MKHNAIQPAYIITITAIYNKHNQNMNNNQNPSISNMKLSMCRHRQKNILECI